MVEEIMVEKFMVEYSAFEMSCNYSKVCRLCQHWESYNHFYIDKTFQTNLLFWSRWSPCAYFEFLKFESHDPTHIKNQETTITLYLANIKWITGLTAPWLSLLTLAVLGSNTCYDYLSNIAKDKYLLRFIITIELLNNKSHGLLPPVGFSSFSFDQAVPYYSQCHLANWNAIYILHR